MNVTALRETQEENEDEQASCHKISGHTTTKGDFYTERLAAEPFKLKDSELVGYSWHPSVLCV